MEHKMYGVSSERLIRRCKCNGNRLQILAKSYVLNFFCQKCVVYFATWKHVLIPQTLQILSKLQYNMNQCFKKISFFLELLYIARWRASYFMNYHKMDKLSRYWCLIHKFWLAGYTVWINEVRAAPIKKKKSSQLEIDKVGKGFPHTLNIL